MINFVILQLKCQNQIGDVSVHHTLFFVHQPLNDKIDIFYLIYIQVTAYLFHVQSYIVIVTQIKNMIIKHN